ncbi:APC family permease [Symbioplanes lichenis]|uniref:APC family permease n=1 Tax=Symbioplanes lichenis TaxID=1629072 RepID=UPI0027383392|nr:APC family permease [Actinoplanes lichenis]
MPPVTTDMALAPGRMGAPGIGLAIASSVAPLTVVAGVVTTGLAVTGLTAVSAAMIALAASLIVFSIGYLAMARHIPNAGAFYAYIAKGIGRPVGVGSSLIALLAYNCFQIASYGGLGAIAAPLVSEWVGAEVPWWALALLVWAVVTWLGRRDVKVSERVLAVLVISETLLVVVYCLAIVAAGDFTFSAAPFSASALFHSGGGALLAIGATAFAGVEQGAVYVEEARDPKRSVPRATIATIVIIGVLYALASWIQISAAGDQVVDRAAAEGPNLFFNLAAVTIGDNAVDIGTILFATSLAAAMIAFHNIIARYAFALGREGVLPRAFARTVGGAPRVASHAQSALALAVIVLFAVAGWDPLVQLFFWGGTTGGVGVLLLITMTGLAVLGYFGRDRHGESLWTARVAPAVAVVLTMAISVFVVDNLSTLYGVEPGTGPAFWMPLVAVVLFVAGLARAWYLRARRPALYLGIGLGPDSAAAVARDGDFADILADQSAGRHGEEVR